MMSMLLLTFLWIIPAGAGKRVVLQVVGFRKRDHPRGCGEKYQII